MKLATLCYVRDGGRTLMIHRTKKANDVHAGKWNGLGGKFEPGETPEECCRREIREECGLTLARPRLKGVLTFPEFAKGEDWYVFVFVADEFEGKVGESSEGDLRWIPDGELLDLNLWDGDRVFLPWLDRPGFFSGKFAYVDGELERHAMTFHKG